MEKVKVFAVSFAWWCLLSDFCELLWCHKGLSHMFLVSRVDCFIHRTFVLHFYH